MYYNRRGNNLRARDRYNPCPKDYKSNAFKLLRKKEEKEKKKREQNIR